MSFTHYHSFDTTPFLLEKWSNTDAPETVIIAGHGFCGAYSDFEDFAKVVLERSPVTAIYASNLRGMGRDPVVNRRGDIEDYSYWLRDLHALTAQVRNWHPNSEIVWAAESLGAMIAVHSYAEATAANLRCDALCLLSPVVEIGDQVASWKIMLAKAAAKLFPNYRLKLNAFTGQQNVQVTQGASDHTLQSSTNDYHVESFTLRQLHAIASLIEGMHTAAQSIDCPLLVINGGNDYFTPPITLENWLTKLTNTSSLTHFYLADSYHLLLYDDQSEEVFRKVSTWLKSSSLSSSSI